MTQRPLDAFGSGADSQGREEEHLSDRPRRVAGNRLLPADHPKFRQGWSVYVPMSRRNVDVSSQREDGEAEEGADRARSPERPEGD